MDVKQRVLMVVDQLIQEGQAVLETKFERRQFGQRAATNYVDLQGFAKWRAGCRNLLRLLGTSAETWSEEFADAVNHFGLAKRMLGTLEAIRQVVEQGLLLTVEDLAVAEAFADLLEQAEYLHSEGYVLAAGVIGRAVLEEHLRKWCQHAGCMPGKPRPTLSDYYGELYKAQKLTKLELKHVESMTAVGNAAAHAGSVSKDDVGRFLRDLSDFLAKHPLT